jgi:hypothetical protein
MLKMLTIDCGLNPLRFKSHRGLNLFACGPTDMFSILEQKWCVS